MRLAGTFIRSTIRETDIYFFVVNPDDAIQKYHYSGNFYESEELEIISDHFPRGGVFLDVGSNVGNHAIFVGKFLRPSQVIVVEPLPLAVDILRINLRANGLQRLVDESLLSTGFSDSNSAAGASILSHNLGATRLDTRDPAGKLRLVPGDSALGGRRVDFIKIDVEGMEMRSLAGLARTISTWRPFMFIEVETANETPFLTWVKSNDYHLICKYRRYPVNENYMIAPVERSI